MAIQAHEIEGTILDVHRNERGYVLVRDVVESLSPEETHARFMADLMSDGGGVPILVRHRTVSEQLTEEEGRSILGSFTLKNS